MATCNRKNERVNTSFPVLRKIRSLRSLDDFLWIEDRTESLRVFPLCAASVCSVFAERRQSFGNNSVNYDVAFSTSNSPKLSILIRLGNDRK